MFNGGGSYTGASLSGYYDTCSRRQVRVLPSNVKVVGPIRIPCSGVLDNPIRFASGNAFDTGSCGNDNQLKWQFYLDQLMSAAPYNINPLEYHHKIMVLPTGFSNYLKSEW